MTLWMIFCLGSAQQICAKPSMKAGCGMSSTPMSCCIVGLRVDLMKCSRLGEQKMPAPPSQMRSESLSKLSRGWGS